MEISQNNLAGCKETKSKTRSTVKSQLSATQIEINRSKTPASKRRWELEMDREIMNQHVQHLPHCVPDSHSELKYSSVKQTPQDGGIGVLHSIKNIFVKARRAGLNSKPVFTRFTISATLDGHRARHTFPLVSILTWSLRFLATWHKYLINPPGDLVHFLHARWI